MRTTLRPSVTERKQLQEYGSIKLHYVLTANLEATLSVKNELHLGMSDI